MNLFRPYIFIALSCALADVTHAHGAEPFMQRISPSDFLHIETVNGLAYSRSCTLVIYTTETGKVWQALTIRPNGNDYLVASHVIGEVPQATQSKKQEFVLPASVGKRVHEAVQLMLEYDVLAPKGPQADIEQHWGTNRWILLRVAPTQVIAGFVRGDNMHHPRSETGFTFSSIIHHLKTLARNFPSDSDPEILLKDLDILTGTFIDSVRPAQRK